MPEKSENFENSPALQHSSFLFLWGLSISIIFVVWSIGNPLNEVLLGISALILLWIPLKDMGVLFCFAKAIYLFSVVFGLLGWVRYFHCGERKGAINLICLIAATVLGFTSLFGFLYFKPLM